MTALRSLPRRLAALVLSMTAVTTAAPSAFAQQDFDVWLAEFRAEALAAGIGEATLGEALAGLEPIAKVIELDRRQPEGRMTMAEYLVKVVPGSRIEAARTRFTKHAGLLREVAAKYGVQPRFIVALWGIETDFGRYTGGYPVIASLATLAYDGRRGDFFRGELIHALRILDNGDIAHGDMMGSWAGAMGQSQFMPSSYHGYAVDYDADGRRDIWLTLPDVFASIANYLARHGWKDDETWGRRVRLPAGFDEGLISLDVAKPIGGWQALGVRRADGTDLPTRQLSASIIQPDGPGTPAYMVYDNFKTTLKWNRSSYFATAVGTLADSMAGM